MDVGSDLDLGRPQIRHPTVGPCVAQERRDHLSVPTRYDQVVAGIWRLEDHCQAVLPATLAPVSSEPITGLARTSAPRASYVGRHVRQPPQCLVDPTFADRELEDIPTHFHQPLVPDVMPLVEVAQQASIPGPNVRVGSGRPGTRPSSACHRLDSAPRTATPRRPRPDRWHFHHLAATASAVRASPPISRARTGSRPRPRLPIRRDDRANIHRFLRGNSAERCSRLSARTRRGGPCRGPAVRVDVRGAIQGLRIESGQEWHARHDLRSRTDPDLPGSGRTRPHFLLPLIPAPSPASSLLLGFLALRKGANASLDGVASTFSQHFRTAVRSAASAW